MASKPVHWIAEGDVFFARGFRLRLRQEIDFDAELITSYGDEVYQEDKRFYWYDDFPHPNDTGLAPTHSHHQHLPPNIKHNRVPAPELSFAWPNLPVLIREVEGLIAG